MKITRKWAVCLMIAVMFALLAHVTIADEKQSAPAKPSEKLTDANFQQAFDALQPPQVEPWNSIPWHISIMESEQQGERVTTDLPSETPQWKRTKCLPAILFKDQPDFQ